MSEFRSSPSIPSHCLPARQCGQGVCVGEELGPLEPGETQGHVGNFTETEGSREGLRSAETLEAIEKPVGVLRGRVEWSPR